MGVLSAQAVPKHYVQNPLPARSHFGCKIRKGEIQQALAEERSKRKGCGASQLCLVGVGVFSSVAQIWGGLRMNT